jgi:hypothetical protein
LEIVGILAREKPESRDGGRTDVVKNSKGVIEDAKQILNKESKYGTCSLNRYPQESRDADSP